MKELVEVLSALASGWISNAGQIALSSNTRERLHQKVINKPTLPPLRAAPAMAAELLNRAEARQLAREKRRRVGKRSGTRDGSGHKRSSKNNNAYGQYNVEAPGAAPCVELDGRQLSPDASEIAINDLFS